MGKYSSGGSYPDPQIGLAALMQAETGRQWLSFSKDAFKVSQQRQTELDALTKRVTEQQLAMGDQQLEWARMDRDRYHQVFQPIEQEFIDEARRYGSKAHQAEAAAEAVGDVRTAAAAQRDEMMREQASLGVNPGSGRFRGVDRAARLDTALATAGAANRARTGARDKGLALRADVANMGRGLPTQSAQAAALGLGAGSGAAGLNFGANQQYLASTGIMNQGFQGQMQGYAGMGSTLNSLYQNQLNAERLRQSSSSDMWGGIGSAIGLIGGFISDPDAKKGKKPVPRGLALKAVKDMPVESWRYKDGVADGGADRHVGPYADDFRKATGLGTGRAIPAQDAIGITMKAVQDLDHKVERLARRVAPGGERRQERRAA